MDIGSVRQFLKPDWIKEIFFILFIFIAPLPFYPFCPNIPEEHGLGSVFFPGYCGGVKFMTVAGFLPIFFKTQMYQTFLNFIILISGIVIWYLLSCKLYSIWIKIKSKM